MAYLNFIVTALLLWLIILPAFTLVHELGHAAVALWLTDRRVVVQLGRSPVRVERQLGRITLRLRLLSHSQGFCRIQDPRGLSRLVLGLFNLGGPMASLIMLGFVWASIPLLSAPDTLLRQVLGVSWLALILQFLLTLIPWRAPTWLGGDNGYASDGYRAWIAFAGGPSRPGGPTDPFQ